MNEAIILVLSIAFLIGYHFLVRKFGEKYIHILKWEISLDKLLRCTLSIIFIAFYAPRLFSLDWLSNQKTLVGNLYLSSVELAFYVIFRWLSLVCVAGTMLDAFFDKKSSKDFLAFVVFPITIINICIFRTNVTVMFHSDMYSWQACLLAAELAVQFILSGKRFVEIITQKDFSNMAKRIGQVALYVLFYTMAFMPVYAPQILVGMKGGESCGFSLTHRLLIYLNFLFVAMVYMVFRKKSKEEIRYMLINLSLSGFISYFSLNAHRSGIGSYPLHLCNTALVLMVFAYVFRLNGVFYFTYLVNVLGSLCAIFLPNTDGSELFSKGIIVFWFNHIYAFALPVLGVMLKEFPRPNLKLFGKSVAAFSVYVLVAAILNAWLNNSPTLNPPGPGHTDVDYFFLYSDFFVEKFSWAKGIKYNFIWNVQVGDTVMRFYYMYEIVIFLIFIALMFAMWGIYACIYRVEDAHIELARLKKLSKVDKLQMLKEMKGRSITEPLHPENADKVVISNFSKVYNGCTKKAVDNLNLEIHSGELFGFIGHNGAGKSTTIKSLVGIQTITEGSIEVCGYDIARQPMKAKEQIGYVSDNHAVYEKLTGREYVYYVAELYNVDKKERDERFDKYMKLFELSHAADDEIKSYSHGMKQKLVLISALVHNPKVWILDEPLTGLDPTSIYQVKQCMREHADAGNIVFFSSHVIDVVEKICDRVAIISGGKLCRVCTSEELRSENVSLEQLYLQFSAHDKPQDIDNKQEVIATEPVVDNAVNKVEE